MHELIIEHVNGAWHLGPAGNLRPVCQDRVPVARFGPGWHPDCAVQVSDSLVLLALRHEEGQRAAWFLDGDLEFRHNAAAGLPEDARAHLQGVAQLVAAQVGASLISGGRGDPACPAPHARLAAALASDAGLRAAVLDAIVPKADSIVLLDASSNDRPDALAAIAQVFGRPADPQAMRRFFRQDLLQVQIDAAQGGVLRMPSPLTGALAPCDAAWCLELAAVAFRFAAPDPDDCFIAVCAGFQLTLFGAYFPRRNLFVHLDARGRAETHRVLRAPPERGLWEHALHYAELLAARPASLTPRLLCYYDHLGHHLWNELAGVAAALAQLGADALPPMLVVNPEATEMYGRAEDIFPELAGKVARLPNGHALVRQVYRDGLLPLRPSGIRVGRDLAKRVSALARRNYFLGLPERMLDSLRRQGYRLVLLGLRVENRTVVDFPAFCEQLIDMLHQEMGRVAVIIDGQNCSESGFRYRVTFQDAAAESPLDIETRIAARLAERFAGSEGVVILSTIGLPVGASIAIGDQADFFVTPWGAGLAKYRWVSNLPGLALAGPSCVRFQPVHLYDDPYFMEAPAPMYFMNPGDVSDAPDDTRLIAPGAEDRVNIRVDMEAMRARIREIIRDTTAGAA